MEFILKIIREVFVYCTDFIINTANLLNISYYEVNALLFVIIWPLLTVGLFVGVILQRMQIRLLKNKQP
jgi:hypothetical protein